MLSTQTTLPNMVKVYVRKLAIALVAIAIGILAWANLLFNINMDANAATITQLHPAVTLDGVTDQIEGKVEKDIGTVERNVGKTTGQTQGALKQAQGKAKQDIGTTKNKLDDAKDAVEDTSESLIDSVKDFFN